MTSILEPKPPVDFSVSPEELSERLKLNKVDLPAEFISKLSELNIVTDTSINELADHSRDWWPLSLQWAQKGMAPTFPGIVVYPTSVKELSEILKTASQFKIPVTPAAGKSGVCGGVICVPGSVSIDLRKLRETFEVDEDSRTLTVSCGFFGPEVEKRLQDDHNLTLGHYPQSFEISTVGGWLACRGAGQLSNRYGKIEDMVVSLKVVLADGSVITTATNAPRAAIGPDLNQLFVGSEGTFGIIGEATLRLHEKAAFIKKVAYSASSFEAGLSFCQKVIQTGANPAVLRLYDAVESERNFKLDDKNIIIILDEGNETLVNANFEVVGSLAVDLEVLEESLVDHWLETRNDVDGLGVYTKMGVCLDTIEISANWANLSQIYQDVIGSLKGVEGTVNASAHQSHAYVSGACIYFTFAGITTDPEDETFNEKYYRKCWDTVMRIVKQHGGAISHHHGIGLNRSLYMEDALGSAFEVLNRIKKALDPDMIMNPYKLGFGIEDIATEIP